MASFQELRGGGERRGHKEEQKGGAGSGEGIGGAAEDIQR